MAIENYSLFKYYLVLRKHKNYILNTRYKIRIIADKCLE